MKSVITLGIILLSTAAFASTNQDSLEKSSGGKCSHSTEQSHSKSKDKSHQTDQGQDSGMNQGQQAGQETGTDQGQQAGQETGTDQGQQAGQETGTDQDQQTGQDESQTTHWQENGPYKVSKFLQSPISINVQDGYVNEIYLQSQDAPTQVSSAKAYLTNGQVVDIEQLNHQQISQGKKIHSHIPYQRPARVSRIELRATSYHLFGPTPRILVGLGMAR